MDWRYGAVVRHNDTGITGMLVARQERKSITPLWRAVTLVDQNLDDADEVNVWGTGHEFDVSETTTIGWKVIEG